MLKTLCITLAVLCLAPAVWATTWDEPWMDDVIRDAESLLKVSVIEVKPDAAKVRVLKLLAGAKTPDEFSITSYVKLRISSATSGATGELQLPFAEKQDFYVFVKKAKGIDEYLIATPTTGFARISPKGVYATFRHSYHQALVPEATYEICMPAIFRRIHGVNAKEDAAWKFVQEHLGKSPALLKEAKTEDAAEFFLQHAALETFRYIGSVADAKMVEPFLSAKDFHIQTSAVRALGRFRTPEIQERMMQFIEGENENFAKVIAAWVLRDQDARGFENRLRKFAATGKDREKETGFGGNIMDPRVGTNFPESVKEAIEEVLKEWNKMPSKVAM
jgi:hypothetical protein